MIKDITHLGFKEARLKLNLFYKKVSGLIYFMDFRKSCSDLEPIFYYKIIDSNIPSWKRRRLIKEEFANFKLNKISFRIFESGFMNITNDFFDIYYHFNETEGLDYSGQIDGIGYCEICEKDFQDDGSFCSKECEENYLYSIGKTCEACEKNIKYCEEIIHHITYFPEETIYVHKKCHSKIHRTKLYQDLRPPEGDSKKFYNKKENMKKCEFCGGLLKGRQKKYCSGICKDNANPKLKRNMEEYIRKTFNTPEDERFRKHELILQAFENTGKPQNQKL